MCLEPHQSSFFAIFTLTKPINYRPTTMSVLVKKKAFRWSVQKDIRLLKVILTTKPTSGDDWDVVATDVGNAITTDLTRRGVKDRFKLLLTSHISETNKKMKR